MSLINDALKKAQKQRASSPAATASIPGGQPKKKSTFRIATVIGLCAVLLSAISVGTTLFILHDDTAAPAHAPATTIATKPPVPSAAPSLPPAPPTAVAAAAVPSSSSTAVVEFSKTPLATSIALPTVSAAAAAPPPTTSIAFPAPKTASVPAPTTSPAPVVPAPANEAIIHPRATDPAQPSPSIQSFVDKFRVAGIRVSDTESKVILNEHLFRLNDLIEPGLGLRLTAIESHALTFTDGNGFSYVKRF